MLSPSTSTIVKQQYEQLPYPPRNPNDEMQRLLRTVGDDLPALNHYCFAGKQHFQNDFRCLIVGGGTGDSAIFLAEQLRGTNARITYLDMSLASREIAQQRAKVRGLDNIEWITASLLDIPTLDLGTFDYINCSGVLHHLSEPKVGLQCLTSVLREDGAMYLMLYGKYGRRGIYDMQELFRLLLPEGSSTSEKLLSARALLKRLPPTNYFQRNREQWESEIGVAGYGDAGLYDLLLHSQDRSYDVDAVYDLLRSANLQLVDFIGPQKRSYSLNHLLNDPALLQLQEALNTQQRFSAAEKLSGNIIKHCFYTAKTVDRSARTADYTKNPQLCIVLTDEMQGMHEQIHQAIVPGETLSFTYTLGNRQEVFQLPGNHINKKLFKYFDGKTPIEKIIGKTKISAGINNTQQIKSEIDHAFTLLHNMGWAYLCNSTATT